MIIIKMHSLLPGKNVFVKGLPLIGVPFASTEIL